MKKYAIGAFALVLLIAGSAFIHAAQPEKKQDVKFWELTDPNTPLDASSYQEITTIGEYQSISCLGDETVCKMKAVDNGNGEPLIQDSDNDGFPDVDGVNVTEVHLRDK